MKNTEKIISTIENYVCIFTLVIMLMFTFANVISRFVLHLSLSFTEEIVTALFVIASLAGASIAVRESAHLGLDFFTSFMPKNIQKILGIFAVFLGIVFCAIIIFYGVDMVYQEYVSKQVSATMQWPEWIYGLTVPVGAGLLLLRFLLDFVYKILNFKGEN